MDARSRSTPTAPTHHLRIMEGAEAAMREGVSIWVEALGPTTRQVAQDRYTLGRFLLNRGRREEADTALAQALGIQREVLTPTHVDLGKTLAILGRLKVEEGNREEGVPMLEEAISILEKVQTEERIDLDELRRMVEEG